MTSIRAEIKAERSTPAHEIIAMWAGPDASHRAHCGILTMTPSEADELIARVEAGEPASGHISPEIAAHVLFHFDREGGYPPSSFKRQLLMTIGHADRANRAFLHRAYPAYVDAFNLAQNHEDGTATLQKIAQGPADGGGHGE